jgi:hypothetical protein
MKSPFEAIARLRIIVGYLGEREQFGWWPSSFLASWSSSFLSPVFSRTWPTAQYTGVVQAAALVHDERIGAGRVFHLFRLPESFEQELHQILLRPSFVEVLHAQFANDGPALELLSPQDVTAASALVGPVLIGAVQKLHSADVWDIVGAHYRRGFESGSQTFPYFSDAQ